MKITLNGVTVHRILETKYPEIIVKFLDGSHEKELHMQGTRETGDEVRKLQPGDKVNLAFDIYSQETPHRWYDNLKITFVEVV